MTKIRAIMIVKEYFPDLTIDQAECLLWKQTGWPCFWPSKEKTVEENLRDELTKLELVCK